MYFFSELNNERGSALVIALLMLVVLTLIGISATTTTTFELQIATNDKLAKKIFFIADGATEVAGELIEQNIEERDWNNVSSGNKVKVPGGTPIDSSNPYIRQNVRIETQNPYMNRDGDGIPADGNRDFVYTANAVDTGPHTNMRLMGNSTLSTGSAVQLIAGYEGKGKGASAGGAWITYDTRAYHNDVRNAQARVLLGWRHVL